MGYMYNLLYLVISCVNRSASVILRIFSVRAVTKISCTFGNEQIILYTNTPDDMGVCFFMIVLSISMQIINLLDGEEIAIRSIHLQNVNIAHRRPGN